MQVAHWLGLRVVADQVGQVGVLAKMLQLAGHCVWVARRLALVEAGEERLLLLLLLLALRLWLLDLLLLLLLLLLLRHLELLRVDLSAHLLGRRLGRAAVAVDLRRVVHSELGCDWLAGELGESAASWLRLPLVGLRGERRTGETCWPAPEEEVRDWN